MRPRRDFSGYDATSKESEIEALVPLVDIPAVKCHGVNEKTYAHPALQGLARFRRHSLVW